MKIGKYSNFRSMGTCSLPCNARSKRNYSHFWEKIPAVTTTIEENVQLQQYNTFHVRAIARHFVNVRDRESLKQLLEEGALTREPSFILGGGSNVLFTGDFQGLIARISVTGIKEISRTGNEVLLQVGAGESWHKFVTYCVENNLGGVENLALIPGTVGAAPIQNIGAYGVEVQEVVAQVMGVDTMEHRVIKFNSDQCRFGYRDSFFKNEGKGRYIITDVLFRLTRGNHKLNITYAALQHALQDFQSNRLSIRSIYDAVIAIRRSKLPDPDQLGNAGSFFKNPVIAHSRWAQLRQAYPGIPMYELNDEEVKIPAAWLIERCGWKGKRDGETGVYEHQPLVIVNYGNAHGNEILNLSKQIQSSVQTEFNIELIPEVTIL